VESSFQHLINYIEQKTAFKCQGYKEKPLKRRIGVRMRALGLSDFSQYYTYLQNNPTELAKLVDVLTINLSYFFRNPETFDYLKNTVFTEFEKRSVVIFWSAGCAHGEEPYSLAIVAAETGLLNKVKIYGTDIDDNALEKAEAGVYSRGAFQYMPGTILNKYFDRAGSGFKIKERLRSRVQFLSSDLFESPSFGPCDLIMCRNVLIYLGRKAQSIVLSNFYNKLKTDGYLMIGKVELLLGIPEAKLFEMINRAEHVYKKIEA